MNQPTDRLGQPLSVGDSIITPTEGVYRRAYAGKVFKVLGFEPDEIDGRPCVVIEITESGACIVAWCHVVTKINPKPKTTTWDQCEWQPESINLTQ